MSNKEQKTKEPNAFEVFDDPKPTGQMENGPIPASIPATWKPEITKSIFGYPMSGNWMISSIERKNMAMMPDKMQFNLNCIRKGDSVVVTIWRYDDAGCVVSQATLNGSISDIAPEKMTIAVVNPLNSSDAEIVIRPTDMVDDNRLKITISCGVMIGPYPYHPYYPNPFGCNDPRGGSWQAPQF